MNEKIIYEFDLNNVEKIRFVVGTFKGKEYYHVRTYAFTTVGETGYLPTKKGITMTKEVLDKFFLGVSELNKHIKEVKNNS